MALRQIGHGRHPVTATGTVTTSGDWRARARLRDLRAVLDSADKTGAKNKLVDEIHRAAIARALPATRDVVLDFGCGVGRLDGWLAGRAGLVVGLEVTPEMLDVARRRVDAEGLGWVLFDGDRLPFADRSIQAIVSVYVLQHVLQAERLSALAREFACVLAPGGRVVVIEQARRDYDRQLDGFITQRLVTTYERAFQESGLVMVEAAPIRIPSPVISALCRLRAPQSLLLSLSGAKLAWSRNRLRHRSADFLFVFEASPK